MKQLNDKLAPSTISARQSRATRQECSVDASLRPVSSRRTSEPRPAALTKLWRMDPDDSEGRYEPPEICDIDSADDREFHVTPGEPGSGGGGRN